MTIQLFHINWVPTDWRDLGINILPLNFFSKPNRKVENYMYVPNYLMHMCKLTDVASNHEEAH